LTEEIRFAIICYKNLQLFWNIFVFTVIFYSVEGRKIMTTNQNILINVEQDDRQEALFMSSSFVSPTVRNRAYLNALGAELISRYLKSEGIEISETRNVHSMSKVLERTDISDILLKNVHIDVRTIFDENQIFIPKSHFDLEILPDVYAVVKFEEDFSSANFLGYILPSQIDKKNQNSEYYFVESSKLSSPDTFSNFVKNFSGKVQKDLSEEDYLKGRELSVSLADHNITESDYREFLELVFANSTLREDVLEFDNFETLSYNTAPLLAQNTEVKTNIDNNLTELLDNNSEEEALTENFDFEENSEEEIVEEPSLENEAPIENFDFEENLEDEIVEEPSLENETLTENFDLEEEFGSEDLSIGLDTNFSEENKENTIQDSTSVSNSEVIPTSEPVKETVVSNEISKPKKIQPAKDFRTLSVDDILDATIASIDTGVNATNLAKDAGATLGVEVAKTVAESAIRSSLSDKDEGISDKETLTNENETKEQDTDKNQNEKTASDEVIKLAGVSGEIIASTVYDKEKNQHKNLDKIDYEKASIYVERPKEYEDIKEIKDLSSAKIEENMEAENSGLYDKPKDLSELNVVEQKTEKEFIQETSSFEDMETVNNENFSQELTENFEVTDLPDISLNADIGNLPLNSDDEGVELMDMNITGGYSINEDGTSTFDNLSSDINLNTENEENFIDFDMGKSSIDKDIEKETSNINTEEPLDDNLINKTEENLIDISESENQSEILEEEVSSNEILNTEDTNIIIEDESEKDEEIVDMNDFFSNEEEEKKEEIYLDGFENNISISEDENLNIETEPITNEFVQNEENEIFVENSQNFENKTNSSDTEWLNADFSELQKNESVEEDIIINEDETQKTNSVIENSKIISDKTFEVGEIPIDINQGDTSDFGNGNIEELYSQSEGASSSLLQNSGRVPTSASVNKKLPLGLAIIGVLISLICVCAIGFGVSKILKPSNNDEPQPITDEPLSTSDNGVNNSDTLDVKPENVVNMNETTPSQVEDLKPTAATTSKQTVQSSTPVAKSTPTSFVQVKKLTWEVPDYVSYDSQFKQYFQSVGKSLKLALSSDLLLATDLVYTNSARISIKFDKDGTYKSAVIVNSSGSTQIDKILLQTVNQTLGGLKAPHSVGNDENTTAILKIYF
jgi:hypothetical protein